MKPRFYGDMLVKTLSLEEIKQENSIIEVENDHELVTQRNRSNLLARNEMLSEEDTLVHSRQQSEVNGLKTSSFEPEELLSSNRGLLPQKQLTDREISMHSYSKTSRVQPAPRRRNSNESINPENRDKLNEVDIDTYSLNSQRSNSDSGLRKMKAYNDALASSYYSRKYTIFFILLCAMISYILINQSILKVTMDNYINNLKSKKDALIKAKERSLKMMDIHRNMRALWWYGTGRLYVQDVSSSGGRPSGIISRLPQYILDLSDANKDLRSAVDHLDVNIRKQIFDRDVRMFETDYGQLPEGFINVTNFEATDSIVGDSLQVAQEAAPNITALVPQMSIILRNILNDVLLQTEDGVLLYLISLGEDITNNTNVIVTSSCCMLSFLIVVLGVLNCILYSQYVKEARYMTSIGSFDLKDVHTIQDRLFRFCKMIEEETSFEELPPLNVSQFYYRRSLKTKSNYKARKQRREIGNTISGIKKKYIFYSLKLSILILMLIGFMGLNSALSENLTKSLKQKVNQIQVMMSLNGNITLLASIAIDMISENDNKLIFNTPPSTLYLYTMQQFTQGKNLALDIFETSANKELQSVQPILFGNQCPTETVPLQPFCYNMTKGQKTAGFVQLSTELESVFVDFKNRYDSSNKSDDMLKSFRVEAQTSLSPKTIVVQAMGILIFKAVNQELEDSISSGLRNNTIGVTLLCTFLVSICFSIYWCVLVKVRESDNEFKRVLQVFPANVVLSNFILRLYVMKAARGNLDSLKSEL